MDKPTDIRVSGDHDPRAYEPRTPRDLENVVDGMEIIEEGDEELEEAVNSIRNNVNQWLRGTLGLTNHPFAIRSLNNPERNQVEVKDRFSSSHIAAEGMEDTGNPSIGRSEIEELERERLTETEFNGEVAGEEFFGINRYISELGDFRDIQWWVLQENGDWEEEDRAGTPEHLTDTPWMGRTYGFRIEADGEVLNREEVISMSQNIERRTMSRPDLDTSVPEFFMRYDTEQEVVENEYQGDRESFEEDMRLAEEMGMVDENELTMMGYLTQFGFDERSPQRRQLVSLLNGEGSFESLSRTELEQLNGLVDFSSYEARVSLSYGRRGRSPDLDLTEVFDIDAESPEVEVDGGDGMFNLSFPVEVDLESGSLKIPREMQDLVDRYGDQLGLDPENPMALMQDRSGRVDIGIGELSDLFVDQPLALDQEYIQDNPSTFRQLYEDDFVRVTESSLTDVSIASIRQESHEESVDSDLLDSINMDMNRGEDSLSYSTDIDDYLETIDNPYLDGDDFYMDGGLPQDPEAIAEHLEGLTAEQALGVDASDLEQVVSQAVTTIVQPGENSFAAMTDDDLNGFTSGLIDALTPDYGSRDNSGDQNSGTIGSFLEDSGYSLTDSMGGSDPVETEEGSTTLGQDGAFRGHNEIMIDRGVVELMPYQDVLEEHGMSLPDLYDNNFRTETINEYDELDDETKTRLRALDEANYISLMERDGTATVRMNRDEEHTKILLELESEWTPEEARIMGSDVYRARTDHEITDISYEESGLVESMAGMLEPTFPSGQTYREVGTGITLEP